jgi:hypothetical protein
MLRCSGMEQERCHRASRIEPPYEKPRGAVAQMSRLGRANSEVIAAVPVAARAARAVASGRSVHLWFLRRRVVARLLLSNGTSLIRG